MKKINTTYALAFFSVLVCVGAVFLLVSIMGVLGDARSFERNIAERTARAESQFLTARFSARFRAETEEARREAESHFLPEADIALFIEEVEKLARLAGVSLEVGGADLKPGNVITFSLLLRSRGSFSSTFRFLGLLETLPYASSVDDVVLEREEMGNWNGIAHLTVASMRDTR